MGGSHLNWNNLARAPHQPIARALALFVLAGLAEIGGGWPVWPWVREGRAWLFGLLGALVLVAYGIALTLQSEAHFGRVYAAYGGISSCCHSPGGGSWMALRQTSGTCSGQQLSGWRRIMFFGPRAC